MSVGGNNSHGNTHEFSVEESSSTGWGKMSQHENRYVSEMGEYVCTKCCSFVHYKTLHKYVASCFIYLKYAKLMETQLSRTNFATQQKEWLGKHCPNFTEKDS